MAVGGPRRPGDRPSVSRPYAAASVAATMRKAIEEGFSLYPNVDLLDVWDQRQHTAENEGFATVRPRKK
jgi:hypothetical protein